MFRTLICAALLLGTGIVGVGAQQAASEKYKVSMVFDKPISNIPGKSLRAVVVEYGPGGSSPSHSHAPSAVIFAQVLEGSIRSKINDGPEKVYNAGESFHEEPGDHHPVTANASETEGARLLAVFVVDTAETALTKPD